MTIFFRNVGNQFHDECPDLYSTQKEERMPSTNTVLAGLTLALALGVFWIIHPSAKSIESSATTIAPSSISLTISAGRSLPSERWDAN